MNTIKTAPKRSKQPSALSFAKNSKRMTKNPSVLQTITAEFQAKKRRIDQRPSRDDTNAYELQKVYGVLPDQFTRTISPTSVRPQIKSGMPSKSTKQAVPMTAQNRKRISQHVTVNAK